MLIRRQRIRLITTSFWFLSSALCLLVLLGSNTAEAQQTSISDIRFHSVDVASHEVAWTFTDWQDQPSTIYYQICNNSGNDSSFFWEGANFGMGDTCRLPDTMCAKYLSITDPSAADGRDPIEHSDLKNHNLEFGNGLDFDVLTRFWCDAGGNDVCANGVAGYWNRLSSRWEIPRRKGDIVEDLFVEISSIREGGSVRSSVTFDGAETIWLLFEGEGLAPEMVSVADVDNQRLDAILVSEIIDLEQTVLPGRSISGNSVAVEIQADDNEGGFSATYRIGSTSESPALLSLLAIGERLPQFLFETGVVLNESPR